MIRDHRIRMTGNRLRPTRSDCFEQVRPCRLISGTALAGSVVRRGRTNRTRVATGPAPPGTTRPGRPALREAAFRRQPRHRNARSGRPDTPAGAGLLGVGRGTDRVAVRHRPRCSAPRVTRRCSPLTRPGPGYLHADEQGAEVVLGTDDDICEEVLPGARGPVFHRQGGPGNRCASGIGATAARMFAVGARRCILPTTPLTWRSRQGADESGVSPCRAPCSSPRSSIWAFAQLSGVLGPLGSASGQHRARLCPGVAGPLGRGRRPGGAARASRHDAAASQRTKPDDQGAVPVRTT